MKVTTNVLSWYNTNIITLIGDIIHGNVSLDLSGTTHFVTSLNVFKAQIDAIKNRNPLSMCIYITLII